MNNDTEILERCAKCGQCRSVCPVFAALKDEALVARGRIAFLKEQLPIHSSRSREIINSCLMCLRCEENCPSLVETGKAFKSGRAQAVREKGLPLPVWIGFNWILPHRRLYDLAMKVLRLFAPLVRSSAPPLRHLPLALGELTAKIPRLAKEPALNFYLSQMAPKRHGAFMALRSKERKENKPKVAIFVGCAINYIYPEVLGDIIKVLDKMGVDYYIPQDQLCCGLPALLSGDIRTARRLARQNIKALKGADIVLTACATCGRMLKTEYSLLLATEIQRTQSNPKIMDVMEFCLERQPAIYNSELSAGGGPASGWNIPQSTFYHAPCHSTWNKSPEMIRSFLRKATAYCESEVDLCCGGGGLFGFKYPELSRRIGQARLDGIVKSNPDVVVTNCPGCMMQLEYLLGSADKGRVKVRHAISMLADTI
ncbi:MAG: (Fe-S)-binding protein [Planctomycetota bacterium]